MPIYVMGVATIRLTELEKHLVFNHITTLDFYSLYNLLLCLLVIILILFLELFEFFMFLQLVICVLSLDHSASKFMKSNQCKILRSAAISHTSTTLCALSLTLIYVLQQQLNTEIHIYLQLQKSIAKRRLSWVPLYYKYWG